MDSFKALIKSLKELGEIMEQMFSYPIQKRYVERVIYNAPATIVFWTDGTKTVVKCHECCYRDCCEK